MTFFSHRAFNSF